MKKTILLLIGLCITVMAEATSPNTISVASTAGGLSSAITTAGGTLGTVTNLTVTGTIDARDFKTMHDNMPSLTVIDLSGATIAAYTGTGGSYTPSSYSYPINQVPGFAFYNLRSLTSITIPTSATSIGNKPFDYCSALITVSPSSLYFSSDNGVLFNKTKTTLIQFPYLTTSYIIPSTVTTIGANAFYDCDGLTSITIPTSVTTIGDGAFNECKGLTSVILPSFLTTLGVSAFANCSGLTSMVFPPSLSSIGDDSFAFCVNLASITIPQGLTSIEAFAFYNCISLTSVNIPSSVTSIGGEVFLACTSLRSITVHTSTPVNLTYSNDVFGSVMYCVLHVPVGSKSAYIAAMHWNELDIIADVATKVNNATASKVKVNTQNGQIIISGLPIGETITICNLQGTAIYNQPANAETIAVTLPAHGVYVVRVGGESIKVLY